MLVSGNGSIEAPYTAEPFKNESKPSSTPTPITNQTTAINIGDYVLMGKYYEEPILWRCVDIDDNGPLMLSDRILCFKAFDVSGYHKYLDGTDQAVDENKLRDAYGSNLWETSNARSWLNSKEDAGYVIWLDGCAPNAYPPDFITNFNIYRGKNAYSNEAGFLSEGNFSQNQRNAIKPVTQKSILNIVDADKLKEGGSARLPTGDIDIETGIPDYDEYYYQYVTDQMFLLDLRQINRIYQNSDILGADYHMAKPTQQAIDNSEYTYDELSITNYSDFWLRTPVTVDYAAYDVFYINFLGSLSNTQGYIAYTGYHMPSRPGCYIRGVRPAFYLDLPAVIFDSGDGSETDPYLFNQ